MFLYYRKCQCLKREKIQSNIYRILPKVNQVIYTLDTICEPNIMILAQAVLQIFSSQGSIGLQWESWKRAITLQRQVWRKRKQVAQRATIAHLSPMCQGQISFPKTYKWAMETRGPKLNTSVPLWLSWLPATLMKIPSKMNELAWRHHFPIISLWEIF